MSSNPLSAITESLQGLFKGFNKKSESVVGIDIGSSAIKIVQLKKEFGKIVLQTYGAIATGPYGEKMAGEIPNLSTDKLAQAVKDVLRESNVNTKDAAMSIQASGSLLFVIDLPVTNPREIAAIVPNEARKYIPVPLTEVSLDWWPIPRQEYTESEEEVEQKSTEVLVVAIRNDTIQQYRDLATSVGLTNDLLEVEVFSTVRSTFHRELAPVLLVDMGAASTRVAIVEYGIVKVFHTINRGSHNITRAIAASLNLKFEEAEKLKQETGLLAEQNEEVQKVINTAVTYIFSEINGVLFNYEREYHKSIGKMILTGGGSQLKGLFERIKEEFKFDVIFGDPFTKAQSPAFLETVLKESGPQFAVATGLALKKLQ